MYFLATSYVSKAVVPEDLYHSKQVCLYSGLHISVILGIRSAFQINLFAFFSACFLLREPENRAACQCFTSALTQEDKGWSLWEDLLRGLSSRGLGPCVLTGLSYLLQTKRQVNLNYLQMRNVGEWQGESLNKW